MTEHAVHCLVGFVGLFVCVFNIGNESSQIDGNRAACLDQGTKAFGKVLQMLDGFTRIWGAAHALVGQQLQVLLTQLASAVDSKMDVLARLSSSFCKVVCGDARKAEDGEVIDGEVLPVPTPNTFGWCGHAPN